MLVPKKMGRLKRTALLIFVIIVTLVIGYLLSDRFIFDRIKTDRSPARQEIEILTLPRLDSELPSDFLTKPPYTNLRPSGRASIVPSNIGRSNPFLRIPFSLISP